MTNVKLTKRTLLASVITMLICFTMLIGTTFAWFTDSVESAGNVITAGNLEVGVEYTLDGENWEDLDGAKDLFQKGSWEPGHTEVVVLKVTNIGSLALKYSVNMNILSETVGKTKDDENIILSDILTVSTLTQHANIVGDICVDLIFDGENRLAYEAVNSFKESNVVEDAGNLLRVLHDLTAFDFDGFASLATHAYVKNSIAQALQDLRSEVPKIDTSGFATKDQINQLKQDISNLQTSKTTNIGISRYSIKESGTITLNKDKYQKIFVNVTGTPSINLLVQLPKCTAGTEIHLLLETTVGLNALNFSAVGGGKLLYEGGNNFYSPRPGIYYEFRFVYEGNIWLVSFSEYGNPAQSYLTIV